MKMPEPIHRFWNEIVTKHKFLITTIVFVVWVAFFDPNNIIRRVGYWRQVKELRHEKDRYQEKIQRDSIRLHLLLNNNDSLERYAREKYLMKRPSEDIFVIIKDTTTYPTDNQNSD